MDAEIARTRMPEEYKNLRMNVLCNDCLARSNVPFHIFGGKCKKCKSYNTTRVE
jgi:phage FluMu protein Com